jgi:D,D-heptose 1,7-bisphosphate phosphatase
MTFRVKQAIFLVGGKGTRLGALTALVPKPLLEIAPGLRFLDVVLEEAARHGFTDIILLAGHLGEQVEAIYHGRTILDATVRVVREPEPQGTGGALAFAAGLLDEWFIMANGDSLFEFNLRALTADQPAGMMARLALREVPDPGRYGAIMLDGHKVVGFHEKSPDLKGPMPINGGVYLMHKSVADRILGPCSIEQDIFPALAKEGALEAQEFDGYFLDIGLPDTYAQAQREVPARRVRPIAFLDRDGVLNEDKGYTHRTEDLVWQPGAQAAIRHLNDKGYTVVVVTNQAGIARGLYSEDQMRAFHAHMQNQLAEHGAHIDAFYHCPFHKDGNVAAFTHPDHPDRKPNPGMLLRAMADWPHTRAGSFLIGDMDSDMGAAAAANIAAVKYEGGDVLTAVKAGIEKGLSTV